MSNDTRAALDQVIDAIESGYEYMLAYAAQGRDQEGGPEPTIRSTLAACEAAVGGLCDRIQAHATRLPGAEAAVGEFLAVVRRDVTAARAALRLALAVPSISSQLVDNLNASIHIRALLTDVFLVDEALKAFARKA